ncbi:MOSC domain-containing protein [Hellea sp.]|nr:MOSC domain-containing protein [Hellea sp.]
MFIYPVKSCRGVSAKSSDLKERGLAHDRRAMLIDSDNQFISLRSHSCMALLKPETIDGALVINIGGKKIKSVPSDVRIDAQVQSDFVSVRVAEGEINKRLSAFFDEDIRLVFMDKITRRFFNANGAKTSVSLADGVPISIVNTASLAELSKTLGYEVSIEQFRPNLVIEASAPWAEDRWRSIRVGNIILNLVKPINRCKIITLDHTTGKQTDAGIMRELIKSRRSGDKRVKGVLFGWAAVPENLARINVGDPVEILENGPPWSIIGN